MAALKLYFLALILLALFVMKKNLTVIASKQNKQSEYLQLLERIKAGFEEKPLVQDREINVDPKVSTQLKEWVMGVATLCVSGKASLVFEEFKPPNVVIELINYIENPDAHHKDQEKEANILKVNIILDTIYDAVNRDLPYFRSEEDFSPYAPHYAPLQTILSSIVIRSQQTVDAYLSSSICTTTNESFHKLTDRSIFYNSLSAGLSSSVLSHVSKNFGYEIKTNLLFDIISTLAIQIHMIKSIASLANLDTNDDAVRTLIYLCIASDGIKDSLARTAKDLALIIMQRMVSNIPTSTSKTIDKQISMKLITEKEEEGIINQFSSIPFIGELFMFI
ncbi:17799_t:CDS:1, partial [Acaulospora morrowiae]